MRRVSEERVGLILLKFPNANIAFGHRGLQRERVLGGVYLEGKIAEAKILTDTYQAYPYVFWKGIVEKSFVFTWLSNNTYWVFMAIDFALVFCHSRRNTYPF